MSEGLRVITGGLVLAGFTAAPADLVLRGDTILDIAPPGSVTDAKRIDAAQRLIIPGLINAHTHAHGALSKGVGDRFSLELLLNAAPSLYGFRVDADRRLSAALNAVEMLRKGCTACFDLALTLPGPSPDALFATAQGYADAGMRAVVAPMIADRSFYEAIPGLLESLPPVARALAEALRPPPAAAIFAQLRAAAEDWPFDPEQIRLGIGPTIPLHCSDDFLRESARLSREYGLPMQTHLAESQTQRAAGLRRYGTTLTQHLHRLGFLGPGLSAAHGIWLDEAELDLLAQHGVAMAHNPSANLRLGSGIADSRAARERGIAVGIGTDGSSSSDHQNMFEAMRIAAYVSRIFDRPPESWIGAAEALEMATQGSAAVLGMGARIGRIAPGFKADLVFLDLGHINFVPLNDAVNQLVNTEDGSAVREVMVGGNIVMRDGAVLGLDWLNLAVQAQEAAARLSVANAPARVVAAQLAPLVGHFCGGLTCHGPQRKFFRRADAPTPSGMD
jgi:5-methylthioadenosine/S-adenosylhomocysteine deaminase